MSKTSSYAIGVARVGIHCCPCGKPAAKYRLGYVCADCLKIEKDMEKASVVRNPKAEKLSEWVAHTYKVHTYKVNYD